MPQCHTKLFYIKTFIIDVEKTVFKQQIITKIISAPIKYYLPKTAQISVQYAL